MPVRHLTTYIHLPPELPPVPVVQEFFRRVFEEYRWFQPVRYGRAMLDGKLNPARIDYDALVAYYERYRNITVAARTDRDFFQLYPSRTDSRPYIGKLTWDTSAAEAMKPSWRATHLRQVVEVMRLVGSPLAQTGLAEDIQRKTQQLVPDPDGMGQREVFTVRDYSEGLAGLFWRNFFGAPFVRLFGERLESVPGEFRTDLGGGIVLVQPYELPTQASTPEGEARERELIARLGPECFYDHERHLKPTRLPELLPRGVE